MISEWYRFFFVQASLFKSSLAPALSYRYEKYVERWCQLYCDCCVFISVLFAQSCYNEETAKLLELQPESLPLKYHRINVRNVTKKWKISKVSCLQWVTTVVYLGFVVWWTTKMSAVSLNVIVTLCVWPHNYQKILYVCTWILWLTGVNRLRLSNN